MRVVHICNLPLPPDHPDVARLTLHPGRWVLNLAKAQQAHTDILPEIVVQVPGASRDHVTEIEGVPVHFLSAPDRLRAATLFYFDARRISRYVRKLTPDLVHAHGTEDAYLLAALTARFPNVVTAQGCYFIINRKIPPKIISRERAVEFTEWIALKRAKHIIAKSNYVADELKRTFPHLTIHEIPNTFDARLIDIPINQSREPGSIAFVGTIVKRKGVHILARALEILKAEVDAKLSCTQNSVLSPQCSLPTLHIFGNRSDCSSGYEKDTIFKLHSLLGDRLVLHGTIPALEVAKKMARIELLVAPSVEEMFGNQLIEALLVGCKAIVTEGTALAENLRLLACGSLVPQGNPAALAGAISQELASQNTTVDSKSARQKIVDWMGPESVAQRHRCVYVTALS